MMDNDELFDVESYSKKTTALVIVLIPALILLTPVFFVLFLISLFIKTIKNSFIR